jgi:hypothetical protein
LCGIHLLSPNKGTYWGAGLKSYNGFSRYADNNSPGRLEHESAYLRELCTQRNGMNLYIPEIMFRIHTVFHFQAVQEQAAAISHIRISFDTVPNFA